MGERRGSRLLIGALLGAVVLAGVNGLVPGQRGTPAAAAYPFPPSCVVTLGGYEVEIESYPAAQITDLDIGMQWGSPVFGDVTLVNDGFTYPSQRTVLTDPGGRLGGVDRVIFDDDAALGYFDTVPPGTDVVRVQPRQDMPGYFPDGRSRWWVQVDSSSGSRRVFDATVTYSDCDDDNDQVGDKTRDNCVGLYNPEQGDRDRDGTGDACDPDDDNDGVADAADNCPTVPNSDQTDWDGDRIGNACDGSPGTAPPPPPPPSTTTPPSTVTPPPTTTPPPATGTPSSTCGAGCAYVSTVGLRHRARKGRLVGTVDSVAVGCRAAIEVTLWRKKSGDDRKLVVVTTTSSGSFRTKAPRKAGRYYATVGTPDQPLCGAATSRVVRIERR